MIRLKVLRAISKKITIKYRTYVDNERREKRERYEGLRSLIRKGWEEKKTSLQVSEESSESSEESVEEKKKDGSNDLDDISEDERKKILGELDLDDSDEESDNDGGSSSSSDGDSNTSSDNKSQKADV